MLKPGPTAPHGLKDEVLDDGPAFGPQRAEFTLLLELEVSGSVSDDETSEAFVADQNVGAEAEDEVGNLEVARREHGVRKLVGGGGFEVEVGWSTDTKGGIRSEQLVTPEARRLRSCRRPKGGRRNASGETVEALAQVQGVARRLRDGRARHCRGKEIMEAPVAPRRPFLPLLLALCVLATWAPTLIGQRAELEKRIQRQVLPNGLEIIVVENRGVPLVTIEADVRNGSFTQGPQFEGLSHLYEHMFFKANDEYPDPDQFVARASELGAVFNGQTREEVVNYYLTLPADSVEGGMRFLAAALKAPLFRKDELERERSVVIGEYDRNESSPFYHFTTAVDKSLWTTSWSRKNPLGERDVILRTTPEQLRYTQHRYYIPNNSAIIVTGDIVPERAFALVRSIFGDWKRGADPFATDPIPPVAPLPRNKGVITEQPVGSVGVMLRRPGPSAVKDAAATYAADVFSDALNQSGSRFQRRLVDSGLFQSIGVNYYTLNQTGPITIAGETSPEKLREALVALDEEITKVVEPNYFTTEELEFTKQHRIVDAMFQLERASGFAHQLGFWWAVTGLDYFYGYTDMMARQTPDDLRSYARTYIIGKPHVVGVLLSPQVRQRLGLTVSELGAPRGQP